MATGRTGARPTSASIGAIRWVLAIVALIALWWLESASTHAEPPALSSSSRFQVADARRHPPDKINSKNNKNATVQKASVADSRPAGPTDTEPVPCTGRPAIHKCGNVTGAATILNPFANMSLNDLYGDKDARNPPKYPEALCELNVIYTGNCGIGVEEGRETWIDCVKRLGAKKFDKILSSRCRSLPVWKSLLANDTTTPGPREWQTLKRGFVYDSQTFTDDETLPYVVPSKRNVAVFTPPRKCGNGCLHYPVSFSMPKANVADKVNRDKWWGFLPYVPEPFPRSSWIVHFGYNDEWLKDQLHRHSYFAFTHKRGGWDCMRHLEILASGAIPYFADIELLPRNSLANYPKELIKEAMALAGLEHVGQTRRHGEHMETEFMHKRGGHVNFKKPGTVQFDKFDKKAYFDLAEKILNHTRHHLTAEAVVSYILKTIGYEEPKHVLMIGRWTYDYLHQSTESGLSDLGIKTTVLGHTTDWVLRKRINEEDGAITEEEMERHRLHHAKHSGFNQIAGLAWMYGFRNLPHVTRHSNKDRHDAGIKKKILDGEYDLVIYTYTENEPVTNRWYWHEVSRMIPKERRVFLHHNDDVGDPDPGSAESCQHGWLFKREMHDASC